MQELPNDFATRLEACYRAAGLYDPTNYWGLEEAAALSACELVAARISGRYQIIEPIAVGGGGITILVEDAELGAKRAVLKVPRPVSGEAERMNDILLGEAEKLTTLAHENVIRIFTTGQADDGNGGTIPYYVMEYIEGRMTALSYLAADPSEERLITIFRAAVAGVAYLHHNGQQPLVHTDLKPDNIFCDANGRIVVADFGFAKYLGKTGTTENVGGTREFIHPDLSRYIEALQPSERDVAESKRVAARRYQREDLNPIWDVYALGVTLIHLLALLDEVAPRTARSYERRYLRLQAYRMLDGHVQYARHMNDGVILSGQTCRARIPETVLGLPESALGELAYHDIGEVFVDVRKLCGEIDLLKQVPELRRHHAEMVHAASHGPIPFTQRIQRLVETPEVRALASLPQLGLVKLVYPTATQSRFEHTLGTLGMTCRIIRALYDDPSNPLFRQIMSANDVARGLVAAILHDIGHYPLAHDLEEADGVFGHEDRGKFMLTKQLSPELASTLAEEWGLTSESIAALLSAKHGQGSIRDQILHSAIDGPIDADKIDYIVRDAESLRLPYGAGIDYVKLLQTLTTVVTATATGKPIAGIGIHEKGRIPAETVAFARYALYGAVYWHRTHRAAKAMLQRMAYGVLSLQYDLRGRQSYKKYLRSQLYRAWQQKSAAPFSDYREERTELQLAVDVAGPQSEEKEDKGEKLDSAISLTASAGQVDPGSVGMLSWLHARTDSEAKYLADDLLNRRLMKRVLVCSHMRVDSRIRWDDVYRVFGTVGTDWRARLRVSEILRESLIEFVKNASVPVIAPGSTVHAVESRDAFVRDAASRAMILVDMPPFKRGSQGGLRFLREEEWSEEVVDSLRTDAVEDSPVWNAISEQGYRANAKLRVYCDADHAPFVRAAVPRDAFEDLVNEAIVQALN